MSDHDTQFRREKRTPGEDAAHVLRWGLVIGVVLFAVLPPIFAWVL